MNKLITLSLVLLLTACSSWPEYNGYANTDTTPSSEAIRIYDKNGNFMGHVDENQRRIYDRDGNYIGMIQK